MSGGVKETLCSTCNKRKVCKYIESFLDLVSKVDALNYESDDIHKVGVGCSEYNSIGR